MPEQANRAAPATKYDLRHCDLAQGGAEYLQYNNLMDARKRKDVC